MGAQERKGRGKDGRRLVHFVFKMAECSIADDNAIFKMEHRPVRSTNFEGKVVFPHPVCQEDHYRIRHLDKAIQYTNNKFLNLRIS